MGFRGFRSAGAAPISTTTPPTVREDETKESRMEFVRRVSEGLARRTSRRGLFGHGAEVATGALLGAAAGTLTRPNAVGAGGGTVCAFPGPACPSGRST